jgi:small conductance mechanosensitive channel
MTRGPSRLNVDIQVPANADVDQARALLNEEGRTFAAERPGEVITAPAVLRIQSIDGETITLRVTAEVKAFRQWELRGELQRRLSRRLADDGLAAPAAAASPSDPT